MATTLYKWLTIPLLGLVLMAGTPGRLHPFHVSVVEINHNPADSVMEISCKIFTDDFERILVKNYKSKVDLINPPDRKATDKLVYDYIKTHLLVKADDKSQTLSYLGFERDNDAIYVYVEITKIPAVKKVEVSTTLMYDLFDDQTNLVHVMVGGNRKTTKLEYPSKQASFQF